MALPALDEVSHLFTFIGQPPAGATRHRTKRRKNRMGWGARADDDCVELYKAEKGGHWAEVCVYI